MPPEIRFEILLKYLLAVNPFHQFPYQASALMCIWKLIHTEKLTSILVTVNGNDLMPPVTPEQKLEDDVENLVRVVGSMSVRATFLIGDGSVQLLKQDPKYNAKVEKLRGMFTARGCHVSTMGDFSGLRMADSLHFHPEEITAMAPAVLRLLQEAQEAPVPLARRQDVRGQRKVLVAVGGHEALNVPPRQRLPYGQRQAAREGEAGEGGEGLHRAG